MQVRITYPLDPGGNESWVGDFDDFLRNNDFTQHEIDAMCECLHDDRPYHGGGGAAPDWVMLPAKSELR